MAQITINEISANYGYAVGTNSFATVALPITAQWGPGYFASSDELLSTNDPDYKENKYCNYMSNVGWDRYASTSAGMEAFLRSYRGPTANFKSVQDYSYHQALTLLNAGYDVLVCRVSPGKRAYQSYATYKKDGDNNITSVEEGVVNLTAKYPGTFGNNLFVQFKKKSKSNCVFNVIVYTKDSSGVRTTLENSICTFSLDEATDFIPYYREIESNFITAISVTEGNIITNDMYIDTVSKTKDKDNNDVYVVVSSKFDGGTDREYDTYDMVAESGSSATLITVKHGSSKLITTEANKLVDSDTVAIKLTNTSTITLSGSTKVKISKDTEPVESISVDVSNIDSPKAEKDAIITLRYDKSKNKFVLDSIINPSDVGITAFKLALSRYAAACTVSNQDGYEFDPSKEDFYSTTKSESEINETNTKTVRYLFSIYNNVGKPQKNAQTGKFSPSKDIVWSLDKLSNVAYREWLFTAVTGISYYKQDDEEGAFDTGVYSLLKDKLKYNAQRVISPGWDDQDLLYLNDILYPDDIIDADEDPIGFNFISPIHARLMDVGYWARCTAALLDIPRSISRCKVYIDQEENTHVGYAQKLARTAIFGEIFDASVSDVGLYPTHSALFAPWGQYKYVKMAKMNIASPAFLALMIHRSQIKGQADQYEWILPRNRQHTLNIGKMDYIVPKKLMDMWQSLEGVGVNIITDIPGLGTNLWGNSTLYEVPEATYQALANLSTRYLVNAIENQAYNAGIGITYTYNNNQAYEQFYAGVTPLLDTMKNIGAIVDYYVKMEADINGLDRVNANTVLGKIYITPVGVINDIVVDLIALPPSVSLDEIRAE